MKSSLPLIAQIIFYASVNAVPLGVPSTQIIVPLSNIGDVANAKVASLVNKQPVKKTKISKIINL